MKIPGFLLTQTGRIILEDIAETIKPMGLVTMEFGLMRLISVYGPINQQSLASRYNLDRTRVTQLVDSMEEKGLVTRQKDSRDRRSNLIHLTPAGRRLFTRAVKQVTRCQNEFLKPLSKEEWELLKSLLVRLLEYHAGK
ncbi:MAG: MarR family winged helix-turn-helix transcriptional regulator [Candidatus Obscuribacterales bacterium]